MKEENSNEHDLQLSIAEVFGMLFKTHREFVNNLVTELRNNVLPAAFSGSDQKRKKFGLFILDDMVEHLGPSYFSQEDYHMIVEHICSFANNKSASLRQASGYGIGIIAQSSGPAFHGKAEVCLSALKNVIEYKMPPTTEEKKAKVQ